MADAVAAPRPAHPVPRRRLGRELSSSAVALGCMGMSEFYGPADRTESIRTVQAAVDAGVTLFDTADVYGPFTNERLLGEALRGRRDQVLISTKAGQLRSADDPGYRGLDGSPGHIHRACDASLERLGVDVIDLYLLHRVDRKVPVEETVGAMADLVAAGKVRAIGLSEVRAATLRRAAAVHPVAVVQSEYSLWSRDVEDELLPALREVDAGLIGYAPLGRGFLTGRLDVARLADDDYRRGLPRLRPGNIDRNEELLLSFVRLARAWDMAPAQLALAWVLARGPNVVALTGTTRRSHLTQNLAAASIPLTPEQLTELDVLFPPGAAAGDRYANRTTIDG
ncbi:aldo/keto reductase [Streptomyces profundus]|uniref:aldo/keto reductase n=1 Tax=Streptomyces profundus TaxID=2867410 RepID=UPI001D1630F9|nr:aldo/keto reductase [Streptomyces sp. MA3_2.13]UED88005.1 aldo/keto reductase [Streptomyces sp. MA3_2.13]